eukprot:TRINITY_DN78408_c0_g1_i1.p1 TRINITY_DN78408_c0_g1~~TRINITY_DN78408_c0_g1_i1.p1  ORF type:complete len:453 (-),score=101.07 TRINITY_DN78408_c0_g1_i1:79-1407(-)
MGKKDKEKDKGKAAKNASRGASPLKPLLFAAVTCSVLGAALLALKSKTASPVEREIKFPFPPDTRSSSCPNEFSFDRAKSKVSIIIPWHNEKWEHLEGTMSALLYFTDDALVEEYIYISDGNDDSKEKELTAMSSKVKVFSFTERQGLILAKMKGVELASGPVLVFMESHCIVNREWLPPLLQRLEEKPRALVQPVLDYIPQTDWTKYYANQAGKSHWRYEWNLNLINSNPGEERKAGVKPYTSPGTSGGILAIRTEWFRHLKFWDPGMLQWGGDHFELSHKVWRCGGLIEMVPCSRIGHLFRDPEYRPYPVEVMQVVQNYKRLAEVWMPDHLSYFYRMKPEAVSLPIKGIEERHKEAEELGCKNMSWYLQNVDHEMLWEMERICHPYVANADKCKGQLAPGRWTITRQDMMPVKEYKKRKAAGDKRLSAEKHGMEKTSGEL